MIITKVAHTGTFLQSWDLHAGGSRGSKSGIAAFVFVSKHKMLVCDRNMISDRKHAFLQSLPKETQITGLTNESKCKTSIHVSKRKNTKFAVLAQQWTLRTMVDVPLSLGNEYSMCDASAGCKWKAILLPVSHHYSFWQLFKSVCVWLCISVSMVCRAYVHPHVC